VAPNSVLIGPATPVPSLLTYLVSSRAAGLPYDVNDPFLQGFMGVISGSVSFDSFNGVRTDSLGNITDFGLRMDIVNRMTPTGASGVCTSISWCGETELTTGPASMIVTTRLDDPTTRVAQFTGTGPLSPRDWT